MKKIGITLLSVMLMFSLTGCEFQFFEHPSEKQDIKSVRKEKMEEDIYYVKDGTKFFPTFKIADNVNNKVSEPTTVVPSKVIWIRGAESQVPDLYKNEILSYTSTKLNSMDKISMERFKNLGYSLGVHDIVYTPEGLSFDRDMNTVEGSDLKEKISSTKSKKIVITQINGEDVTEDMIKNGNVINGLEKDKEYELSLYAGTYYGTVTVKADTQMLQSYELYNINNIDMTQNGYLSISMPKDGKAGYYVISNYGLYRYYDYEKKDKSNNSEVDMNVKYYETEEDQLAAFSQQYTFTLDGSKKDISVSFEYEETENDVKAMLTSPDGTTYNMKVNEDSEVPQMICKLKEALPGKWRVNIAPSELGVKGINVESNEPYTDMTKEEFPQVLEEDTTNYIFKAEYEGEGKVNGIIVDESGTTYTMSQDTKEHTVTYNANFLKAGTYKMIIYHYPETKITNTSAYKDSGEIETDIITVTE